MYTCAVTSSLYCSIWHTKFKLELFQAFNEIDEFMARTAKLHLDYENWNKILSKLFIWFWFLSILSISYFLFSTHYSNPEFIAYAWHLNFLNHAVHMEAFYVFILTQNVKNRLREMSNFEVAEKPENLEILRKMHQKLNDVVLKIKLCFQAPIFFNLMQINSSMLINLYWMSMAFLDIPYALISGKKLFHCFITEIYIKLF